MDNKDTKEEKIEKSKEVKTEENKEVKNSKKDKLDKMKEGYAKVSEKMIDENIDFIGDKFAKYLSEFIMFPLYLLDYFIIYSHGKEIVRSKVKSISRLSALSLCILFVAMTIITKDYTYLIGLVLGLLIISLLKGVLK